MSELIDDLKYCAGIAGEKCIYLEELLKKKIKNYSDLTRLTDATCDGLTWYYYCYSIGDVLACLEEEFSVPVKTIVAENFRSLDNYADFLKENLNL